MKRPLVLLRRLAPAAAALTGALVAPAFAGVVSLSQMQDRDVARMVSLGGSSLWLHSTVN